MTDVQVLETPEDVAVQTAEIIIRSAQEAIAARGRFTLAFTGGPVPQKAYELLAQPERSSRIDWGRTYVFWGDERVGGPEHDDSNYASVKRLLLAHVPIPDDHVFPMAIATGTMEQQAQEYADSLARFFGTPVHGLPPRLDLFLLGLGEDGHMASLFPGADSLSIRDRWAVSTPPGTLPPPIERVTTTFPVINAARRVLFIVSGASKAVAVRDVLEGREPLENRPAVGVQPADGEVVWLLDREAARLSPNALASK